MGEMFKGVLIRLNSGQFELSTYSKGSHFTSLVQVFRKLISIFPGELMFKAWKPINVIEWLFMPAQFCNPSRLTSCGWVYQRWFNYNKSHIIIINYKLNRSITVSIYICLLLSLSKDRKPVFFKRWIFIKPRIYVPKLAYFISKYIQD